MVHRLLALFSGFPSRHFPNRIAEQLKEGIINRKSLVFVSAWPEDYERNDMDSDGMHQMFAEYEMPFDKHYVIDNRMKASCARQMILEASCVFLMGGHPGLQSRLLLELGLDTAIHESNAAVLGVSAGAINMAKRSLDTKESLLPYRGLDLTNITVKPHFEPDSQDILSTLMKVSMELPICAMEDDSAIFVMDGHVSHTGIIYWISKGRVCLFTDEMPVA